jgi:hypothetical protein
MTTPGESQTESESGSGRQVSEVASFRGAGVPISPDDAVAGAPTAESGEVDEGPTGPDAPTYDARQDRHPDKDDVETTG